MMTIGIAIIERIKLIRRRCPPPLEPGVDAMEGRPVNAYERDAADRGHLRSHERQLEEVGDEVDGRGGVGEVAQQLGDARLGPQRQRDVDDVDLALAARRHEVKTAFPGTRS